jgi:hypothetical protein
MANYARRVRRAAFAEWLRLRAEGHAVAELADLRSARRCRVRLRKARRLPNCSRCANNCGSCGPDRARPKINLWPTWVLPR